MNNIKQALTFDDVLLVPAYSKVLPSQVDLKAQLSRGLSLSIPLVSAAMDTVTEADLAIALAQLGGLGFIHKNMPLTEQVAQIRQVKKFESGVIRDPITVSPNTSIKAVIDLTRRHQISGVPVVEGRQLVGIITHRDLRFETRRNDPVSTIMTPKENLVTVKENADAKEVRRLLHKYKIEKVLVVNDEFELCGMITVKDIQKAEQFPNASKDADGRLRVGASIGIGDVAIERGAAAIEAGADILVIDTAHGHSQRVLDSITMIKKDFPDTQLMAGNVATAEAASALLDKGVDAIKVGVGPGSICTTRVIAGVGMPQFSAIYEVAQAVKGEVPLIADGGIRFSGDLSKAIAAGAEVVMIGSLFAGTLEAPGEIELYQGRAYKAYRGMGSLAAMQRGARDRYGQSDIANEKLVPEGIEGRVPYRGGLADVVYQLLGGLRSGMGYVGCAAIAQMHEKVQFIQITEAGMRESHVHDVSITKEASNYHVE
ncbi:MAG: IMP dehydrogenase [Chromatiales bacterium]|nr:IMP dehydrogenase [Chromatiales bacterium]